METGGGKVPEQHVRTNSLSAHSISTNPEDLDSACQKTSETIFIDILTHVSIVQSYLRDWGFRRRGIKIPVTGPVMGQTTLGNLGERSECRCCKMSTIACKSEMVQGNLKLHGLIAD